MNDEKMRRRVGWLLASVFALAALSPQVGAIADLPDALVMETGGVASVEVSLPLSAQVSGEAPGVARVDRSGGSSLSVMAGEESGTAEVGGGKSPTAWFAGFLRNEDAPYAFVVAVEEGGSGSQTAGNVAAAVLNALVNGN